MKKTLQVLMMTLAFALMATASDEWETPPVIPNAVPEIDGASAASAVALIAGGLMVIRSKRRN